MLLEQLIPTLIDANMSHYHMFIICICQAVSYIDMHCVITHITLYVSNLMFHGTIWKAKTHVNPGICFDTQTVAVMKINCTYRLLWLHFGYTCLTHRMFGQIWTMSHWTFCQTNPWLPNFIYSYFLFTYIILEVKTDKRIPRQ